MTGRRVLIVDDDLSFVEAVAIYLEDHGFRVIKACTARDGIMACRRQRIDLAIVDVHLPDLEGTEVANALERWQPSIPVLFISSDDSPDTAGRCLANAHTFMAKPLIPHKLLETVSQLCRAGNTKGPGTIQTAARKQVS